MGDKMTRENLLEKVIKKIEEIEPDKWLRSEGEKESLITYSTNIENFGVALESRFRIFPFYTFSLKLYKDGEKFAAFDGVDAVYEDIRTCSYVGPLIEDLYRSVDTDYKNFAEKKTQQPSKTEILLKELLEKLGGK